MWRCNITASLCNTALTAHLSGVTRWQQMNNQGCHASQNSGVAQLEKGADDDAIYSNLGIILTLQNHQFFNFFQFNKFTKNIIPNAYSFRGHRL